jgi:hypothetical protein
MMIDPDNRLIHQSAAKKTASAMRAGGFLLLSYAHEIDPQARWGYSCAHGA